MVSNRKKNLVISCNFHKDKVFVTESSFVLNSAEMLPKQLFSRNFCSFRFLPLIPFNIESPSHGAFQLYQILQIVMHHHLDSMAVQNIP
jgi:hypothetical protein